MPRVLLVVFTLAVTIFAVAEIAVTRPEKFPSGQFPGGIPKAFWILIATLTAPVGGLAWIVISRVQLADEKGISVGEVFRRGRGQAVPSAPEPVAPDDDPEFLWRLEKELYQRRKEARAADATDDSAVQDAPGTTGGPGGNAAAEDSDGKQLDSGKDGNEDDDSSAASR